MAVLWHFYKFFPVERARSLKVPKSNLIRLFLSSELFEKDHFLFEVFFRTLRARAFVLFKEQNSSF
jgi:hypothetical protein